MKTIEQLTAGSQPVLIMFYTPGCPRCQAMAPVVDRLKDSTKGIAVIHEVDLSADPAMKTKYKIPVCPGWVLFKDGQPVWSDGGEKTYSELKDMIDRFV